jgi:hypothetical protein
MWALLVFSVACAPADGGYAAARDAGCTQGDEDGYCEGETDGAYAAAAWCPGDDYEPDPGDAPERARAFCDDAAAAEAFDLSPDNTVSPCVPGFVEGYRECWLSAYDEAYAYWCPR